MKKELKYKIRRTLFMYTPVVLMWSGIFMLAMVKAGIYVIG